MLAAILTCSLALQDALPSDPAPGIATGTHFEVKCHAFPEGTAEIALAEAEAAHSALAAVLDSEGVAGDGAAGGADLEVGTALEVHVYVSKESFERAVRDMAEGALQFLEPAEGRAHVCLQPLISPEALGDLGLPWRTRREIAASAAQLTLRAWTRDKPDVPLWLIEGLGLWAAEQAALETRSEYAPEADPYYGWGQEYVRDNVREEKIELQDVVTGKGPDWHASRLALLHHHVVRFLLRPDQRELASRIFVAALAQEGSKGFDKRIGKALRRREWKALEKGFSRYCAELAPEWMHLDGMLDLQGERWLHATTDGNTNYTWHAGEVGAKGLAVRGEVTLLGSSMGVLLMETDKAFLLVSFSAANQKFTVFEYDRDQRSWETLATEAAPIELNKEFSFSVEARARHLKVFIEGTELLDLSLGRRKTAGRWGLYGAGGAAGIWTGVRVEEGKGR